MSGQRPNLGLRTAYLASGLLIICGILGVEGYDASAVRINVPLRAYIWSSMDIYNPYRELSDREKMLSEWVICKSGRSIMLHMVYYDDKLTTSGSIGGTAVSAAARLQQQNQGKEYYWKFLNSTGVLPGVTIANTTFKAILGFVTLADDYIAYHATYRRVFFTELSVPSMDLIIEFPPNSGSWKTYKTLVEASAYGLLRWRFSNAPLTPWEEIIKNATSLESYPLDSSNVMLQNFTHIVAPQHVQELRNPCVPDLVTFYIIVQKRPTGRRSIYLTVPLLMDENGPDWVDVTDAFCSSNNTVNNLTVPECGVIRKLILTNEHLLALSTRGIYVSERLGSIPFTESKESLKPFLPFSLVNPCSDLGDVLNCFDSEDENRVPFPAPLIHGDAIGIHFNPVCHSLQVPRYQDIVTIVIMENKVGEGPTEPPSKAVTILYSEAPYGTWTLLVKTVAFFDNSSNEIRSVKSIFFNHERAHFDAVVEVFTRGPEITRYIRFVLPLKTKPGDYYTKLGTAQGDGFLATYFPESFSFLRTETSVGSMDVMFLGDQLWIAEAGGPVVYQASTGLVRPGVIEYCRFNHPDRSFVCVTKDHTTLLLGKVGSFYAPQEIRATNIPQVDSVASEELWKIEVDRGLSAVDQEWMDKFSGAHLIKGLSGAYFTISYQGNLVMWYLKGSARNEKDLLENLRDSIETRVDPATPSPSNTKIYDMYKKRYDTKNNDFKQGSSVRYAVKSIDIPSLRNLAGVPTNSPLVPFLIDATSALLYEASFPTESGMREPKHLSRAQTGMTILCQAWEAGTLSTEEECDLYIRRVRQLRGSGWLPGFNNVASVYVSKSITMYALKCETDVHVVAQSNKAFIYIRRGKIDDYKSDAATSKDFVCETWDLPGSPGFSHLIGWTFYVPGHFSVLINRIYNNSQHPANGTEDSIAPTRWNDTNFHVLGGLATVVVNTRVTVRLGQFEGFLINMNTMAYLNALHPIRHPEDTYVKDPWKLVNTECLFDMRLVSNPFLKSSGGSVFLDLHDRISFTVKLFSKNSKGDIMLQHILMRSTNSNPKILSVKRRFKNNRASQVYEFFVSPTGYGKGIGTLVVRQTSCSLTCPTPCSMTFIFHMMRKPGRNLKVRYPTSKEVTEEEILDDEDTFSDNHTLIYKQLPFCANAMGLFRITSHKEINYRPPTTDKGTDLPTSENIYNGDPSKPKHENWYKASKETGQYKHCRDKLNRKACGCTKQDKLEGHPHYSDCKEKVFVWRRAQEVVVKLTYLRIMPAEQQFKRFYLHKPYYAVRVEEVNGRTGYSLTSGNGTDTAYLKTINTNDKLNRGYKYYNASDLRFILYGTGLFHFKATLGEFDSFDEVTGYILIYSNTSGLTDIVFVLIMIASLSLCFILLFCGFLRVRKRLMAHLPRHDVLVMKEKVS